MTNSKCKHTNSKPKTIFFFFIYQPSSIKKQNKKKPKKQCSEINTSHSPMCLKMIPIQYKYLKTHPTTMVLIHYNVYDHPPIYP
ncbi:hypothetical protein Hanom_Chr04g00334841 [Helianthus anomalus]